VEALLHLAHQNRAVARTAQNERSSRSHSVFQLQISGEHAARGLQCGAPLNLVDLAGSERLDSGLALGPGERDRLRETQAINSSLSTLGLVIMALSNKVGKGSWADETRGLVKMGYAELWPILSSCLPPQPSRSLMYLTGTANSPTCYRTRWVAVLRCEWQGQMEGICWELRCWDEECKGTTVGSSSLLLNTNAGLDLFSFPRLMFVNISPLEENVSESLNSLRFASKVQLPPNAGPVRTPGLL
jgi:hypothetical protein